MGHIELRHLRSFVILAQELHFARAAERLHMTQSALSTQIQNLERHLGARLLERSKRAAVTLTVAGALFLEEARKTLEQVRKAEWIGRRAGRGELGQVEVGYVASATFSGLLPGIAFDFRQGHPRIELRLQEMATPRQLESLYQGHLDVGFLRPRLEYPEGITALHLLREPLIVALRHDHPAVARGSGAVLVDELAAETFIVPQFDEDGGFEPQLKTIAARRGFEITHIHRVRDFLTALSLVGAGFGVALVPASLQTVRIAGIDYRSLAQCPETADLVAAFRRDERAPAVCDFIACLHSAAAGALQLARSA